MSTHRARKRIREAKRKARPELATSDMWVAKDFLNKFDLNYAKVDDTVRIKVALIVRVKNLKNVKLKFRNSKDKEV